MVCIKGRWRRIKFYEKRKKWSNIYEKQIKHTQMDRKNARQTYESNPWQMNYQDGDDPPILTYSFGRIITKVTIVTEDRRRLMRDR